MTVIEDATNALQELSQLLNGDITNVGCHCFIKSTKSLKRKKDWFRVKMDPEVARKIVVATQGVVSTLRQQCEENHIAEFDFDAMLDGDLAVSKLSDIEGLGLWFDEIPVDTLVDIYQGEDDIAERAYIYTRRINFPNGKKLLAVSGKSGIAVNLVAKGRISAAFDRDEGLMKSIKSPIISFDGKVDFFLWGDYVFICKIRPFESLTNVRSATIKKAKVAFTHCAGIFDMGPTEDDLLNYISDKPSLAKRLAAAHKWGFMNDMAAPALQARALQKQLDLSFDTDPHSGKVSLKIDNADKRQVEDLIDLLCENFLQSPTTGREYEARFKRPARERAKAAR
ncbi:Kiwa anti-phage protein KwaB-like domain-containing protein [Xanthomonas vesicatoria]|uniref:Kiwa anti-phage protein KwaB-like domain-containing protein n=1 Tax=Xanthomonas vesicatoria TaxID=56460 RepID=UPI001E343221|nr:Kiwa anti-phage protein KwaB-like domain-containing protein [Xanthomonas vesicatoria]MCC8625765.1 DUF4868 domain-containing protein [Xanthomonas vesicatoria]MDG4484007.1 DUF4868 domain-containing protein [Xanthomonas vesicatoria]